MPLIKAAHESRPDRAPHLSPAGTESRRARALRALHRRHRRLRAESTDRDHAREGPRVRRVARRAPGRSAARQRRAGDVGDRSAGRASSRAAEARRCAPWIEHRVVLSLAVQRRRRHASGCTLYPFPGDDPLLGLIRVERPVVYAGFAYTYATLWFSTPFFLSSIVLLAAVHLRRALGSAGDAAAAARRIPPPEQRAGSVPGARRAASPDRARTRAADADVARHSRARPLHRACSSSAPSARARRRPACIPTSSSSSRIAPTIPTRKVARPRPGSERATSAGRSATSSQRHGRGRRLRRGQSRLAVPLQPAAQRSRRLRAGLRHRHADDQPLRPRQGAVLAAGQHEPRQVRDPAAPGRSTTTSRSSRSTSTSSTRTSCGPGSRKGERRFSAPTTGASWSTSASTSFTAALQRRGRGTTTTTGTRDVDGLVGGPRGRASTRAEHSVPRSMDVPPAPARPTRVAQFEAVKRWFEDDWMRIEPKLRTSIVEGISVFLSLFDDNPRVKYTFCPPKDTYDPARNPNGRCTARRCRRSRT